MSVLINGVEVLPLPTVAPPPVGSTSLMGTSSNVAREDHTHKSSVQCKFGTTDSNGQVTVTWDPGFFSSTPMPLSTTVLDPAGSAYTATLMSISTASATYQIRKLRPLPATLTLLTVLQNYDMAPIAPAGLTVYASAKGT